MLDPQRSMRLGSLRRVAALSSLNAGLFVGADDTVVLTQRLAFPEALVEIQDASGFGLEHRVTREEPTAEAPRPDCILGKPAPKRGVADGSYKSPSEDLSLDLRNRVARQGQPLLLGELTGQGFDGYHHAGGKSGLAARLAVALATPRGVARRTAYAIC